MNNRKSYILTYGIIAVIIIALIAYLVVRGGGAQDQGSQAAPPSATPSGTTQVIGPVTFSCDAGKSIDATFNNNSAGTSTVSLVLSDGRELTIPQTISADGGRYANADETFVFWNKGNTAFVEEGNTNVPSPTQTYQNCTAPASA